MAAKRNAPNQTPETHETALQVAHTVVARAASWSSVNGYDGSIAAYAEHAGLTRYRRNPGATVTVDLAKVIGELPTSVTLEGIPASRSGQVDAYHVFDKLRYHMYYLVKESAVGAEGAYTTAEPSAEVIDPQAYLGGSWGLYTFPELAFGTDEAKAEAVRIVTAVLEAAAGNSDCGTVENMLHQIGLGPVMPPLTTDMTVELDGVGTVAFTVENDRKGEPRKDRMAIKIRQALADRLAQDLASGKVTPVAVMLAASPNE